MKLWFMNKTKFFVALSCIIVVAGIVAGILFGGLNLGIDFTGGSLLSIEFGQPYDQQDINDALSANGVDPATAQIVGSGENNTGAVVRMQAFAEGTNPKAVRDGIIASLQAKYPSAEAGDVETVGGATTTDIIRNAFLSVLIASALMMVYIWIRFTLFSGIAGVIALVHDVLIMTAFVCIARVQINSAYIAACLTIVGYSINDTIVVFDRIRENNRKYSLKSMTRSEIADISIRETLPRTINTSLTTLITITAVYIFGVTSIKEFSLPLIIGILGGTYSSIFIATPIWIGMEDWRAKRLHGKMAKTKA